MALAKAASTTLRAYSQLELEFDAQSATLWSWMTPKPRPCFNYDLLDEIARSERPIESQQGYINECGTPRRVDYMVFGSKTPGVFNLGGDLEMFMDAIMRQDRQILRRYASLCIENQYRRSRGFEADVTTIALVRGKALGGGFESVLACDVAIAERSSTFAFPEVLFNMFPGMGALSFLTRRLGQRKSEELITGGNVLSARDLLDLGIVDEVVEDGLGIEATRAFIRHRQRRGKSYRAFQLAKRLCQPVTRDELTSIVEVWVDAAMRLDARDLRMMSRLIRAQDRLAAMAAEDEHAVDALFEGQPFALLRG
jgi:DSF synthase